MTADDSNRPNSSVHLESSTQSSPPRLPELEQTLSSSLTLERSQGTLDELCSNASQAISRAAQVLRQHAVSIRYREVPGVHWHLFLDYQTPNLVETCAISTAILAISAADDHQDNALINSAIEILLAVQNESGGWTSWVEVGKESPQPEASLIIDTFFAVRALDVVYGRTEATARARNWLCEIQDPATGGWGFYAGGTPALLPTTMALRVLAASVPTDRTPEWRQAIDRGLQWLFYAQDKSPFLAWGKTIDDAPSAVHTAMSLMALRACGIAVNSHRIERARTWLLNHCHDRTHLIDVYDTPGLDTQGTTIPSRRIHHVSFPEGIILQGILASGCTLLEPRLLELVQALIKLQSAQGSWLCPSTAFECPVFAMMDATLALRTFLDETNADSSRLEILETLRMLKTELNDLRNSNAVMAQSIGSLESEMARAQNTMKVLKPVIFLRDMQTYLKVAILLLIVAAAVGIATANASGPEAAIISGAVAFVTIAVAVIIYIIQERNATTERLKEQR